MYYLFYWGNINMLWVSALAIGIVIIAGFMMLAKLLKKEPIPVSYKGIHIVATAIGAVIALITALTVDSRLWTNIVLAVIIVILGLVMALGKLKKNSAMRVLFFHATIGIICYSLFLYYIITM